MTETAASPSTPEQIVDLIRAAVEDRFSMRHRFSIRRDEAIDLIEQYAAVVAAEAAIKATTEAYDKCIAVTDEALSKPLTTARTEMAVG